jgi:HD-GYP domain-containing protein (c-di-GMP phosphodiesterase class II)
MIRADAILLAVSRGMDIVEAEIVKGVASGHGRRVALLCRSMGKALGMSNDELLTLSVCALLHDSALTEWLVSGDVSQAHCVLGQQNIMTIPLPTDATDYVLYHHERGDGSGLFGKADPPLAAEIISLADAYDAAAADDLGQGFYKGFSHAILDVFKSEVNLVSESDNPLPEWYLPGKDAMKLGGVIAKAIDYKSKFTRRHSTGIAAKAEQMGRFYGYDEDELAKLYLAACLHDLGKLATPTAILEKPGRLTDEEFVTIKNHALMTHELLDGVDEDIRHWATSHHEKLDGSGYPFGIGEELMHFNAKLMSCVDIYQAVSEERPYHPARTHDETMYILKQMGAAGEIDNKIINDMDIALG